MLGDESFNPKEMLVAGAVKTADVVSVAAITGYDAAANGLSLARDGVISICSMLWNVVFGEKGGALFATKASDVILALRDGIIVGLGYASDGLRWLALSLVDVIVAFGSWLWSVLVGAGTWLGAQLGDGGVSIADGLSGFFKW